MKKLFLLSLVLSLIILIVLATLSSCDSGNTETPVVSAEPTKTSEEAPSETQATATQTVSTAKPPVTFYYGTKRTLIYAVNSELGGSIEGKATQTLRGVQPSEKVTAIPSEGYEFIKWSDGVTEPSREGDLITETPVTITAIFRLKVNDFAIPSIYMTTDSGKTIENKTYQGAVIKVTGTGDTRYDGEFTTQIRGRGNSSWEPDHTQGEYVSKNSYRLKLDESQEFLGIGDSDNRDWVLNSSKFDASLLRNWIGYRLGSMLEGIDYSAECTWAYLYLNGDYRGVYLVTEHPEAANDRIEIDEKTENEDNGFMLELDMRGDWEPGAVEGVDYFYVNGYAEDETNKREWVIKSDLSENPDIAAKQFEFIKNYVQTVSDTIASGNREEIEKLIDIDSFIDMLIISEFTKDCDVNTASMYLYKPAGGKLYFTCPWDYDFGFGTYGPAVSPLGMVTGSEFSNQWFGELELREWFATLVCDRFEEIKPLLFRLIDETMSMGEKLRAAADSNAEEWNLYGTRFHRYVDSSVSMFCFSYDDHLFFLSTWMTARISEMETGFELFLDPDYKASLNVYN